MKNSVILVITLAYICLLSCNNSGDKNKESNSDDLYFTFTIDGKVFI